MRSIILVLSLLLSMPAFAGKLADGFRGLPYGDALVLEAPPMELCSDVTGDPGAKWQCPTTIGAASVTVTYVIQEGYFPGVIIDAEGFDTCLTLFETLKAAYGPGTRQNDYDTSTLADWIWRDGPVFATWSYNRFSNKGQLIIVDSGVFMKVKEARAQKASSSVGDL